MNLFILSIGRYWCQNYPQLSLSECVNAAFDGLFRLQKNSEFNQSSKWLFFKQLRIRQDAWKSEQRRNTMIALTQVDKKRTVRLKLTWDQFAGVGKQWKNFTGLRANFITAKVQASIETLVRLKKATVTKLLTTCAIVY